MFPRPGEGRSAGKEARTDAGLALAFVAHQYLADLATRSRPRGVAESRAILDRVTAELGAATVGELSRPAVLTWRQKRIAAGASNKTVNNALAVLFAALALCVRLEQLPANPLLGIRSLPTGPRHQRRRPRALTEWEIARLLGAADELDREGQDFISARVTIAHATKGQAYASKTRPARIPQAILVRTLIETGARWGELTLATWADLDEPGASLTFRAENTKTDQERTVPLRVELVEALRAYRLLCAGSLGSMPPGSAPIFLSPQGRPWTHGTANFRRFLTEAYERAGLLERGPDGKPRPPDGRALNVHTLRHTCCTRLARAGAPLPVAQAMLGHASPAMTARVYSHVSAEDARGVIEAMGRTAASVPNPGRAAQEK